MAGLWEHWAKEGDVRNSFTVITTTPAKQIEWVHSRMPLMVQPEDLDCWLTGSPDEAEALLVKKPDHPILVEPGDPKAPPEV